MRREYSEVDDGQLAIRNALDRILASAAFASEVQLHARHIELLAATHRHLHAQRTRRAVPDAGQLSLF